jgi:hypothetical protein
MMLVISDLFHFVIMTIILLLPALLLIQSPRRLFNRGISLFIMGECRLKLAKLCLGTYNQHWQAPSWENKFQFTTRRQTLGI